MKTSSSCRYRSPLSKARGLGSAKDGTHHWWLQRLTALALIPLGVWFVYSVVSLTLLESPNAVVNWLFEPTPALLTLLMLTAMLWHAKLGVQVVIEDYVHGECIKITLLIANTFVFMLAGAASIAAVLTMHLGTSLP